MPSWVHVPRHMDPCSGAGVKFFNNQLGMTPASTWLHHTECANIARTKRLSAAIYITTGGPCNIVMKVVRVAVVLAVAEVVVVVVATAGAMLGAAEVMQALAAVVVGWQRRCEWRRW